MISFDDEVWLKMNMNMNMRMNCAGIWMSFGDPLYCICFRMLDWTGLMVRIGTISVGKFLTSWFGWVQLMNAHGALNHQLTSI